ncbi:MAG: PKD domain-containing protein [Bacteroidales bacterium]
MEQFANYSNCNHHSATCFGQSNGFANAHINGGTPSYSYGWIPSGTAGNVNTVSTLAAGTYTFTAYDLHGCSIDTTFTITQPPMLTYTYVTDSVKCFSGSDGSIIITTSGGISPYAYTWNPWVSTGSTAINISAGTYQVTITDHNGCDTVASITIGEPSQISLITSGNVTICRGQSTIISATASGGTGNYIYTWDNGLGNGSAFTVTPSTTTTYTVYVTDVNSCTSIPLSLTVFVSPPINVNLVASPNALCFGSGNVTLIASANGGTGSYTYTWGQGIGISTSTISITPTSTTWYSITVTDNCGSPAGIDSVKVTVYPLPNILFSADTMSGCIPLGVIFSDSTTPAIASWSWDFGEPASGANNTSTQQNPTHLYTTSDTFNVTLSVITTNGCAGSYTYQNMIIVHPTPVAQFSSNPVFSNILNPIISFIDLSIGAVSWNWNFNDPITGDSNVSVLESPEHYFSNPGYYNVSLIVTSQYGCIDSTESQIVIDPIFTFYMPNAFVPGKNGVNNYFYPKGQGWDLSNYEFLIYNRWGARIFETTNYSIQWDGTINGELVPQDVYVWMVVLKDFTGEAHTFRGHVTLIR